ncbi:WYL domain-containing protein [Acinetobacter sp. NBRC 100985]|uniref:WYL domain-containing protein n=1 Tax=Acinetobacter sp. NBRC 100985 TaxID=1071390 RepID=UPI000235FA27|nr:WYL domain-containing protein [Acinetobacter sp. NBRC 100985]GAB03222.1 hypothetical protein ACT4_053_00220 [Acinetobacter sp. NBRC 100985]
MVEFILIIVVGCCIYCFATGKFKPEYQKKQKEKLKEDFKNLLNPNDVSAEIDGIRNLNPSNQEYEIHYDDFNQKFSSRKIKIQRLYKENRRWYIDAYCYSACDKRTFRVDRISYLTNKKKSIYLSDSDKILDYLKLHF